MGQTCQGIRMGWVGRINYIYYIFYEYLNMNYITKCMKKLAKKVLTVILICVLVI